MGGRKMTLIAMCVVYSLATAGALGGIAVKAIEDNEREQPADDVSLAVGMMQVETLASLDGRGNAGMTAQASSGAHQQATVPRETSAQAATGGEMASTTMTQQGSTVTSTTMAQQGSTASATTAQQGSTASATAAQQEGTMSATTAQRETAASWGSDAYGLCVSDKGSVKIRSERTADSELVGWVPKDATCELMEEPDGTWVRIRYNGKVGYVDFNYFTIVAR